MRAIVFERNGGPEVLELREVPAPDPGEGEVLVDVEAIGVNYRDVYERNGGGYGSEPPAIIGVEGAGKIRDSGERVAWAHIAGSYAEQIGHPRERLIPIPDRVSTEVAAAALLQGMTAHYLAVDSYPIAPGDWVLVHAAAGGVGLLLTQIAKARGGRVIATTSTEEKANLARGAGADEVIGYDGFAARAREITGGEGVAAIYDGVGKATFLDGFKALGPAGRMILYGAASGRPDPIDPGMLVAGSWYVQRPTLGTYTRTPQLLQERARAVFELIESGKLDVRIGARYPLEEARQAHEDLEGRKTTGKILLTP
ncbi:MAG TPA: quinone oxidoreductase [Solirubrobacteraceae bacterium]|jgi:NADPH2:quinone reductase|nr:quinone oxidoreductase [Solirubrobacteraceae bacterium]